MIKPRLTLRGTALGDPLEVEPSVLQLVAELAIELGDDLSALHHVVVADHAVYGDAIREVTGESFGATHTDRKVYQGVAKAIPRLTVEGDANNTVVVCAGVVAAAMGREGIEPAMPAWMGRYILRHEFAHCADFMARRRPESLSIHTEGEFSISRISLYYRRLILEEVVACVLAAEALQETELREMLNMDAEPLEEELAEIMQRRSRFMQRIDGDLYSLAFDASQCFWVVLMQYAKARAHMIGAKRSSSDVAFPPILAKRPDAVAALHELSRLLDSKSPEYPEWPDDGWPELHDLWLRIARAFGFVFAEEKDGSSALWLHPPVLDP